MSQNHKDVLGSKTSLLVANNKEKYEKFIVWELNIKYCKQISAINDFKMKMERIMMDFESGLLYIFGSMIV